jgi:hypothetical protein
VWCGNHKCPEAQALNGTGHMTSCPTTLLRIRIMKQETETKLNELARRTHRGATSSSKRRWSIWSRTTNGSKARCRIVWQRLKPRSGFSVLPNWRGASCRRIPKTISESLLTDKLRRLRAPSDAPEPCFFSFGHAFSPSEHSLHRMFPTALSTGIPGRGRPL